MKLIARRIRILADGDEPGTWETISVIRAAVDLGVSFFDAAEVYGPFTNEKGCG